MPNKRRRTPEKQPQISKAENQKLDRFGCAFRERTGVFCVDWRGKSAAQAANAEIFARLAYIKNERGPIVLLACEIAPVRPLPRYFYFPFDLSNQVHRKYLSGLAETGEIRLRFLADKETVDRTHRLTPYLRSRASETCAEVLRELETSENDKSDFDAALQLLERHVRIPLFLNRVLLEDTLREITSKVTEAVQRVPNENREFARSIVREASEAFVPYYQSNGKTLFEKFDGYRAGLVCLSDLRRMFADNPAGLIEFLSDGLAGTLSRKDLEGLSQLLKFVLSLTKLPFREEVRKQSSATEASSQIPELPAGLVALVQSMVPSGIPRNATSKLLELIGLEVGGRPGRPTKDYSREYERKISGASWSEVTRQALTERPELQAELGGADYDSLDYSDRERLQNRIRQGVIAYAKRTGKPLPSEAELSGPTPPNPEQRNP